MEWSGVIAIDGPAGAGKSTVARRVAQRLGVNYLDTGALYRGLAFYLDAQGQPPQEDGNLVRLLSQVSVRQSSGRVIVNDQDVTDQIRLPRVSEIVSAYAALPSVRERLLDLQREQTLDGALVADGRDMATVVFPLAPVKVFLTASPQVRADRRWKELQAQGIQRSYDDVLAEIQRRDRSDTERDIAPLRRAPDAELLDTSDLTIDGAVDWILTLVEKRLLEEKSHGA